MGNNSTFEMEPLKTTRQMMAWLSMCPSNESPSIQQKTINYIVNIHTLAVLIANVSCGLASLAYCLQFISIDFDGAVLALMIFIGEFGLVYFMFVGILMRQQIDKILMSLTVLYQTSKLIR